MSEFPRMVMQAARIFTCRLLSILNNTGQSCGSRCASFRALGLPRGGWRGLPAVLLLLSAALLAIPATAQADPVVGAKFSIASGWMGISATSDGTNFLIPLESDTSAARVAAQLVSSSGAKIGSVIALGHDGQSCCVAGAAFDGTNYLVAWEEDQGIKNDWSPFKVYGQFVNTSGVPAGPAFAMTSAGITFNALNMLAYGGGKYLLTYTRLIDPAKGDASTNTLPDGSFLPTAAWAGNSRSVKVMALSLASRLTGQTSS